MPWLRCAGTAAAGTTTVAAPAALGLAGLVEHRVEVAAAAGGVDEAVGDRVERDGASAIGAGRSVVMLMGIGVLRG